MSGHWARDVGRLASAVRVTPTSLHAKLTRDRAPSPRLRFVSTEGSDRVATHVRYALTSDPSQVTHIVCCRAEWDMTICGFAVTNGHINVAGDPCAMCVAMVEDLWRSHGAPVDEHCPYDASPCPSDEWLFDRIARQTT